jgi:hypothetical protein
MKNKYLYNIRRFIALALVVVFTITSVQPTVYAQTLPGVSAPIIGALSPVVPYAPVVIKGIKVFPNEPMRFDFIVDRGDAHLEGQDFEDESQKLIKYFLASLTIPEEDLWVNLSPEEPDRIVPKYFGATEMGRDLLAQDYLLKQLTATLMHPDNEHGQKFWEKVHAQVKDKYGDTNVSIETLNKVWIIPENAVVYEGNDVAYVVESDLKVMLERDYLEAKGGQSNSQDEFTSGIMRDIIVPAIEDEINNGKSFAQLRQIFNSLILATWYKRKLKTSLVSQVYADQHKTAGVEFTEGDDINRIYTNYVNAFKAGVFEFIKEEYDEVNQDFVARKYISGGVRGDMASLTVIEDDIKPRVQNIKAAVVSVSLRVQHGVGVLDNASLSIGDFNNRLRLLGNTDRQRLPNHLEKLGLRGGFIGEDQLAEFDYEKYRPVTFESLEEKAMHQRITKVTPLALVTLAILAPLVLDDRFNPDMNDQYVSMMTAGLSAFLIGFLALFAKSNWNVVFNEDELLRDLYLEQEWLQDHFNEEPSVPNQVVLDYIDQLQRNGWAVVWVEDSDFIYGNFIDEKVIMLNVGFAFVPYDGDSLQIMMNVLDGLLEEEGLSVWVNDVKEEHSSDSHKEVDDANLDQEVGGIDFNPDAWELGINGADGVDCVSQPNHANCIQLNVSPEKIKLMRDNITGFVPVIIDIVPVINLPLLLGLREVQDVNELLANENMHRESLSAVKEDEFKRELIAV